MKKTKNQIRKIFQEKRDDLSESKIKDISISISNKCLDIPIWDLENLDKYWCCYFL